MPNLPRVALIGCGFLGSRHAKNLHAFKGQIEFVGVCDASADKAKSIGKQLHVPFYSDYKDLSQRVDGVVICTPTETHAAIADFFLSQQCHVFVEKPMTMTSAEADALIAKATAHQLILQVGHVERFNSAYQTIEPLIKNPLFIECHRLNLFPNRSLDIGVVMDVMIHDIDIILGLVKSTVRDVHAVGVNVLTDKEDIANARISFENGCVANITSSRISPEVTRKIRIFTSDAYISLDYANQAAKLYTKDAKGIHQKSIPIEKEEPLKLEIQHFINCIKTKQQPIVSGREGRDALVLALDITHKIWQHKQNISLS